MRILIALILLLQSVSPIHAHNFSNWSSAASIFDGKTISGAVKPSITPSLSGLPITPDIWGPGGLPNKYSQDIPKGIGPISTEKNPSYLAGLFGGLLGLLMAPIAFALEMAQAALFTPVRMARGLAQGDWTSILEPVRTVKNIIQDAIASTGGILSSLSAPLWNAFAPNKSTDFIYANNRLIFVGGPFREIIDLFNGVPSAGVAPSWHTVVVDRATLSDTQRGLSSTQTFHHEFVHNKQWQKSFWNERTGENYKGFKGWRNEDAEEYLNW